MGIFKFFKKQKSRIEAINKEGKDLNNDSEELAFIKDRPSFTPEHISILSHDEVFVFGSNLEGHHGGGAARTALIKFGAINGQGVGLQGQSYGIPTMHGGVETIAPYVNDFIDFAIEHPDKFFYVTRIGCGIAGFKDEEIAPLFNKAFSLDNVCLPETFVFSQIKQPIGKEKMNTPVTIKLTKSILDEILPNEIIYAEFAGEGAMGNAGGVMLYIIKKNTLLCYETNVFTNEEIYLQTVELLLRHQDQIENNDIVVQEKLFDHFYGGMGNNVFVNKDILLEIRDGYFLLRRDRIEYQILPSVIGVFNSVVHAMKNSKNN